MRYIGIFVLIISISINIISCDDKETTIEYKYEAQGVITDIGYTILNFTQNIPVIDTINTLNKGENPFAIAEGKNGIAANGLYEGSALIRGDYSTNGDINLNVALDNYSDNKDYKYAGNLVLTGRITYSEFPPQIRFLYYNVKGSLKLDGKFQEYIEIDVNWQNKTLIGTITTPKKNQWGVFTFSLGYK